MEIITACHWHTTVALAFVKASGKAGQGPLKRGMVHARRPEFFRGLLQGATLPLRLDGSSFLPVMPVMSRHRHLRTSTFRTPASCVHLQTHLVVRRPDRHDTGPTVVRGVSMIRLRTDDGFNEGPRITLHDFKASGATNTACACSRPEEIHIASHGVTSTHKNSRANDNVQ